tara:strand:+ start:693 stop:1001 length:309 start_codon:yes stop_codon:yes gene_type:complete
VLIIKLFTPIKPAYLSLLSLILSAQLIAQYFTSLSPKIYITQNITSNLPPNMGGVLDDLVCSPMIVNGDDFQTDKNLDGSMDYSLENPDFSYVQFNYNLVLL